jgi:hypothetical protein
MSVEDVVNLVGGGTAKNFKFKINRIMVSDDFIFMVNKVHGTTSVTVNPMLVWMGGKHAPSSLVTGMFEIAKEKYLAKKV